jgi:UPF0716 protein FxsA
MALLFLIAWPVAELIVAFEIAGAIGVLPMILLLILSWPIGLWAMRSQGRAVWRRLGTAASEKRQPTAEVVDGALILTGGALMIIPGFITDAIGLFFLLPPTRVATRALVIRNFRSRFVAQAVRFTPARGYDVDATAHDVEPPQLHA